MKLPPQLIEDLLKVQPRTRADLGRWKRIAAKQFNVSIPTNQTLLDHIREAALQVPTDTSAVSPYITIERILRVRDVRTLSGVAIITVLVKPYACPGQCVYCPTEVRMPKSYIETEPAAQRALRLNFDPYIQMIKRLEVLDRNGHPTEKIELIVKGGTWSAYPKAYQRWFLKECYRAANAFARDEEMNRLRDEESTDVIKPTSYSEVESLNQGDRKLVETYNKQGAWANGEASEQEILDEQLRNETSTHRVIGLTLETRPDWIDEAEVRQLRILGCTRVELGAQAIDDEILTLIKRGHDVASIANAIALLRDAGFKVDVHMMPQLPGARPQKDVQMFRELFEDPRFRPDMVKIYPCVVTPSAELYQWYKNGTYAPYSDEELIETLITIKSTIIPRYCRISRLIRDIPSQHIAAGNKVTNLRETLHHIMKERGLVCQCLRCREVGHQIEKFPIPNSQFPTLFIDEYEASGGKEYFLSMESENRGVVYAFCRLRIPAALANRHPEQREGSLNDQKDSSVVQLPQNDALLQLLPEIKGCAFIRELHTYGQMIPLEEKGDASQHTGLGRQLMEKAEEIVKQCNIQKIAVISGVGVRGYYRKLGYNLEGTYMVKGIKR